MRIIRIHIFTHIYIYRTPTFVCFVGWLLYIRRRYIYTTSKCTRASFHKYSCI